MKVAIFLLLREVRKAIDTTFLAKIPGFLRVSNKLYHIFYPKGIITLNIQGSKMAMDAKDIGIVPWLLGYGVHEEYETSLFKKALKSGMTVLDIGANIGYYSLIAARIVEPHGQSPWHFLTRPWGGILSEPTAKGRGASRRVGPKGKVYAFEPEEKSYELLHTNIKQNHFQNIIPVQKALSNKTGERKLYLDKANLAAATFAEKNLHTEKEGSIGVETTTLDEFLKSVGNPKVAVIKIDVQGAEGLVFEGAKRTLKERPLTILMEFWPMGLRNLGTDPQKLLRSLKAKGFTIRLIDAENRRCKRLPLTSIINIAQSFKERERSVNLLLSSPKP